VIGIDLPMQDAVWLSRLTDSNRLVERYREGRVARPKFFRILTIPTNAVGGFKVQVQHFRNRR
jgi:hypothetical protein